MRRRVRIEKGEAGESRLTIGNVTGHLVLGDDEIFGDRLGLFLFVRHGGGGGGAAAVGWRAVARKKSGSDAKKREVPYSLADER